MARSLDAPVLISANALRRRDGTFRAPSGLDGLDAALDSAGFVAMVRYGGFPWTVAAYCMAAVAYPWSWWASMDCCCEPEIARDRDAVLERVRETARLLGECRRYGEPMPVLQGWLPDDYERSVELAGGLPSLVGVGSVCRRPLRLLMPIIERLDRALPAHVRLHLFGVKSEAIEHLAQHERVASVDSMAWDFRARRAAHKASVSCTIAHRSDHMRRWYRRQQERLHDGRRQLCLSL